MHLTRFSISKSILLSWILLSVEMKSTSKPMNLLLLSSFPSFSFILPLSFSLSVFFFYFFFETPIQSLKNLVELWRVVTFFYIYSNMIQRLNLRQQYNLNSLSSWFGLKVSMLRVWNQAYRYLSNGNKDFMPVHCTNFWGVFRIDVGVMAKSRGKMKKFSITICRHKAYNLHTVEFSNQLKLTYYVIFVVDFVVVVFV